MRVVNVKTPKSYKIQIEKGLVKHNLMPKGTIISDVNIAKTYNSLIKNNKSLIIGSGEKNKSNSVYFKIIERLNNEKTIIAFGGGVVGDIAGFVAATYKRGISLIQIPTTLLAMVDSGIGGKNGINLGKKKNYIGTVYQPEVVLIDPLFLETLPDIEFQNGVAEIIKYAAVFNKPALERLEEPLSLENQDLEKIIFQCCEVKAKIVKKDEQDKGHRHTLNFGHTIGHAIEILYNLPHGQAISIGMIKELELGEKLGIIDQEKIEEVRKVLEINNLPTKLPKNSDTDKIIELIKADKKGTFVFAFDKRNFNVEVSEEKVREVLVSWS